MINFNKISLINKTYNYIIFNNNNYKNLNHIIYFNYNKKNYYKYKYL